MDLQELKQHFVRDNVARRLGNLASTLHRLADFIEIRRPTDSVIALIDEAARFAEWTRDDVDPERAGLLDELLEDLVHWRTLISAEGSLSDASIEVEGRARDWTNRIIDVSGLSAEV